MTNLKSKKQLITEAVLSEISSDGLEIDQVMFDWWYTGRQKEGLRLTDTGMRAFEKAQIEYYEHPFGDEFSTGYYGFVSELSKKIKCPYYLGVNKISSDERFYIRLYDSKIAMMLALYGNLRGYLDSIKENKSGRGR